MNPDSKIGRIAWVLRIGAVMEFVGHGALGIIGVASWTSYFAVVGIGASTAHTLMPIVGCFDVTLALAILLRPSRPLIVYMAAWGLWTALLRPLSGESTWEAIERAGNYGALAGLFFLSPRGTPSGGLGFGIPGGFDSVNTTLLRWTLLLTTVLLLAGHGALGLMGKPLFATHYAALGIRSPGFESGVGLFECLLAAALLFKPSRGLLLGVFAWKIATELLSPVAGSTVWVFIEHGGSYAAPLALALMAPAPRSAAHEGTRPAGVGGTVEA